MLALDYALQTFINDTQNGAKYAAANFDNPVTRSNSASFGRITSIAGRPRLMQFALRLNF